MVIALLSATSGCARAVADRSAGDAGEADSSRATDAPAIAIDARGDAALDAAQLAMPDAGCTIATGVTPLLDGIDDLAAYPAAQRTAPAAMMGADGAAIAWDRDRLYVTVASAAFAGAYEPLHVYVETRTEMGAAIPSTGKEYGGLTPALPFTPTHLIAIRRVTDAGSGPYDGVYVPAGGWMMRATALAPGTDAFASADQQVLSVQVPWTALGGCPTRMRLVLHVVHGMAGNEWKDLVPAGHTPWLAPGGGFYDIDLTGASAIASWTLVQP